MMPNSTEILFQQVTAYHTDLVGILTNISTKSTPPSLRGLTIKNKSISTDYNYSDCTTDESKPKDREWFCDASNPTWLEWTLFAEYLRHVLRNDFRLEIFEFVKDHDKKSFPDKSAIAVYVCNETHGYFGQIRFLKLDPLVLAQNRALCLLNIVSFLVDQKPDLCPWVSTQTTPTPVLTSP